MRQDAFMGSDGRMSFCLEDGAALDESPVFCQGVDSVEEPFPMEDGEVVGWYEENADIGQWIDSPQVQLTTGSH